MTIRAKKKTVPQLVHLALHMMKARRLQVKDMAMRHYVLCTIGLHICATPTKLCNCHFKKKINGDTALALSNKNLPSNCNFKVKTSSLLISNRNIPPLCIVNAPVSTACCAMLLGTSAYTKFRPNQ